jgi:hypothetical protein
MESQGEDCDDRAKGTQKSVCNSAIVPDSSYELRETP